jgi:hypothetical protein
VARGAEDGRASCVAVAGSKPPLPSEAVVEDGLESASSKVASVLAGVPARRPWGGCPEVLLTRGVTNSEVSPLQQHELAGCQKACCRQSLLCTQVAAGCCSAVHAGYIAGPAS